MSQMLGEQVGIGLTSPPIRPYASGYRGDGFRDAGYAEQGIGFDQGIFALTVGQPKPLA